MSHSPAKRPRRSSRPDEIGSTTSSQKWNPANFDVEFDEYHKTCQSIESNPAPVSAEEAPSTPSPNSKSKRKQTLTHRQWFNEEVVSSLTHAEEDLSAPVSPKTLAKVCGISVDKNTSKSGTRTRRSSTQSPVKRSPQTPSSQPKAKRKLGSTPSHESDDKNTPDETHKSSKRNSTITSQERSPRTPKSHSKAKSQPISPLHKQALSKASQRGGRCSLAQIEEALDEDEPSALSEKPNRTPTSARRRLAIAPSDKEATSGKLNLTCVKEPDTLPRIEESRWNSVSPEKPDRASRSDTSARRQVDVNSPEKQILIANSDSSPIKEALISLSQFDETRGISVSLEKPDPTPRSNSTARCPVDVTPNKETFSPRRSTRAMRLTPQKFLDYDTTPNSARRTLLRKEAVTPSRSKGTPSKRGEAPGTPKSARRTPSRKSIFSTPQSAKFRIDPNTPRTPIDEARANLHISAIPQSLPCRQTEFDTIYNFLVRKIESQSGGVMYISGVPGTGKTATVHKVVALLQEEQDEEGIDPFYFVEVNALRVSEPRQAYVKIWKDLTGELASVPVAQSSLEKRFSRPAKKATIILVDELDYLCNRKQDVIYNILDWTTKRDSRLIVLTIANTMDLPERTLKGRVTSRMGLTRLMFQPYNHTQLQQIVTNRLEKFNVFHPDAVQLVSRKVAAVSGDARRALDICRKATDLVDKDKMLVTIQHVQKVLNNIFAGPRIQAIQHCSEIEQLILRSLRDESHRTGVEETYLKKMYQTLTALCGIEALHVPDIGCVSQLCTKLSNMGLIIAENTTSAYLYRKLILNVSADDLHFALEDLNSS